MKFGLKNIIVATFVVASIGNLYAQDDVLSKAKFAFAKGNANSLVNYFNNQVEISFDGNKVSYNKNQSEIVLTDFFKKNQVKDFIIKHEGNSKEGLKYAIGTLQCQSGNYRIYLLIKQFNGIFLIDTLDFSKE